MENRSYGRAANRPGEALGTVRWTRCAANSSGRLVRKRHDEESWTRMVRLPTKPCRTRPCRRLGFISESAAHACIDIRYPSTAGKYCSNTGNEKAPEKLHQKHVLKMKRRGRQVDRERKSRCPGQVERGFPAPMRTRRHGAPSAHTGLNFTWPRFMQGVEEMKQHDERLLHWRAEIGGKQEERDADITQNIPGIYIIAWCNIAGAGNAGEASFTRLDEAKTRVSVRMSYAHLPTGQAAPAPCLPGFPPEEQAARRWRTGCTRPAALPGSPPGSRRPIRGARPENFRTRGTPAIRMACACPAAGSPEARCQGYRQDPAPRAGPTSRRAPPHRSGAAM